jgi:hypothetical protein
MAADIDNIDLGPCIVYWNGVDMGHTIGGCSLNYSPEFHETKVDRHAGAVERWLTGEKLSAVVPLAESTLANINRSAAHSTLHGSSNVSFGTVTGKRASDVAGTLVLHPVANATNDKSDDAVIWKAHATSDVVIDYKPDGEKILNTTFEGLVDEARGDGKYLGLIGDSAS